MKQFLLNVVTFLHIYKNAFLLFIFYWKIQILKKHEKILYKLDVSLEALEVDESDILEKAEKGIQITKLALKELRSLVIDFQFKSKAQEICCFKNIKPQVYSKLIYYIKLFNVESKRPRGSSKSQIKYFNHHIDKLQSYFNENLEFYHYYRRRATFLDEQYFLRGKANIRLHPDTFYFFTDEEFSTSHDSTVATILAYDLLIVYLKQEIDKLEHQKSTLLYKPQQLSKITWTGHKTDLIELIYAIYASGTVNNGTAEIKDIARVTERIFKVDLGNYYHTFIEIKSRKINQTKYLDKLKESFLSYIKKSDE